MGNYDLIAPVYDPLSRLVFGKSQVRAQRELLHFISPDAKILIVGGGTGWILDDLAGQNREITFVESSGKMLELARKRKAEGVTFVQSRIETFRPGALYDVILTGFLFDNFSQELAGRVFAQLDALLRPGGIWLYTEFHLDRVRSVWWQKGLIRVMYTFFRVVARLEVSRLVDMEPTFAAKNYEIRGKTTYFGGLIISIAFKRSINPI